MIGSPVLLPPKPCCVSGSYSYIVIYRPGIYTIVFSVPQCFWVKSCSVNAASAAVDVADAMLATCSADHPNCWRLLQNSGYLNLYFFIYWIWISLCGLNKVSYLKRRRDEEEGKLLLAFGEDPDSTLIRDNMRSLLNMMEELIRLTMSPTEFRERSKFWAFSWRWLYSSLWSIWMFSNRMISLVGFFQISSAQLGPTDQLLNNSYLKGEITTLQYP